MSRTVGSGTTRRVQKKTKGLPPKPPLMHWQSFATLMLMVRRADRALQLLAAPAPSGGRWAVVALERPADAIDADQVFDDHAHKLIGTYPTAFAALEAAESYALAWLNGRPWGRKTEPCECDEIKIESPERPHPDDPIVLDRRLEARLEARSHALMTCPECRSNGTHAETCIRAPAAPPLALSEAPQRAPSLGLSASTQRVIDSLTPKERELVEKRLGRR